MNFEVKRGKRIQKHPDLASIEADICNPNDSSGAKLLVRLRLNEDEAKTLLGTIRYQLRKASVKLKFDGCKSTSVNKALDSVIELYTDQEIELQVSTATDTSQSRDVSGSVDSLAKVSGAASQHAAETRSKTASEKLSLKTRRPNVIVSGEPHALRVSLESPVPSRPLRGRVEPEDWCTVTAGPRYGRVTASIHVESDDVLIQRVGGIWPRDVSDDKRFIIRLIALRYLDYSDYLSIDELFVAPIEALPLETADSMVSADDDVVLAPAGGTA
jgi:hypothetical protein